METNNFNAIDVVLNGGDAVLWKFMDRNGFFLLRFFDLTLRLFRSSRNSLRWIDGFSN